MNILLVLVGMLLGVVGTFGAQVVGRMYSDWRMRQRWANAGKRWREIMDNMSYKRVSGHWTPKVLTPEERFDDLQRRVSALFDGTPIDFNETLESLKISENRLPEYELEEHRERAENRVSAGVVDARELIVKKQK